MADPYNLKGKRYWDEGLVNFVFATGMGVFSASNGDLIVAVAMFAMAGLVAKKFGDARDDGDLDPFAPKPWNPDADVNGGDC